MKVCACSAQGVLPEAHPWPKWSVPTLCGTTAQLQVTRAAAHLILCSEDPTLGFFGKAKALAFWPLLIWSAITQLLKWNNCHWLPSSVHPNSHFRLIFLSFAKLSCAGLGMLVVQTAGRCDGRAGSVDHFLRLLCSQRWWREFGPLLCTSDQIFCPCYLCSSLFGGLRFYCKRNRFSSCFFWAG